jgi:hypothetical protein
MNGEWVHLLEGEADVCVVDGIAHDEVVYLVELLVRVLERLAAGGSVVE